MARLRKSVVTIEIVRKPMWGVLYRADWFEEFDGRRFERRVWICLVPMFPIHISWSGKWMLPWIRLGKN